MLIIGAYSAFLTSLFTPVHVDAGVPVGLRAGGRWLAWSWEVVSHPILLAAGSWEILRHLIWTFEVPSIIVKKKHNNPLSYTRQQLNARNVSRWKVKKQSCYSDGFSVFVCAWALSEAIWASVLNVGCSSSCRCSAVCPVPMCLMVYRTEIYWHR